jgi:hypothetical protein
MLADPRIEQGHDGVQDFADVGQFVHVPAILLAEVLQIVDDLLDPFGVLGNVVHAARDRLSCLRESSSPASRKSALLLLVLVENRQGILPDAASSRAFARMA